MDQAFGDVGGGELVVGHAHQQRLQVGVPELLGEREQGQIAGEPAPAPAQLEPDRGTADAHEQIMRAVEARDGEKAAALTRRHLEGMRDLLTDVLTKRTARK